MLATPRPTTPPRVVLPSPAPVPSVAQRDDSVPMPPPPGVATRDRETGSEIGLDLAWLAILLGLVVVGAGVFAWRWRVRSRRNVVLLNTRVPTGPMPPPQPADPNAGVRFWTPAAPKTTPAAPTESTAPLPRGRIDVSLTARRAGLNLLSAIAEVEVEVRNTGEGAAGAVSVALHLFGASSGQDDDLGRLFAAPSMRPAEPPFALAPGEARTIRTTLSLSRAAIIPLVAGERQMFVPVVAVDVRYALPDGGEGQTASAFMVGATREGSDKLAPFWLDAAPRTEEQVGARPHALSIAR
jgi:hypothetical protein